MAPLTNRVRAFLPGNVSSQVPPVRESALLTVTVSDPVPLTESVIVPVYTVWGAPAIGSGSVGVEALLHAVTAANTTAIKRIRIIATPLSSDYYTTGVFCTPLDSWRIRRLSASDDPESNCHAVGDSLARLIFGYVRPQRPE